jgi:hypothetical protein
MIIESLLLGILGNFAYDLLKTTFKDICGQDDVPFFDNIYNALGMTQGDVFIVS